MTPFMDQMIFNKLTLVMALLETASIDRAIKADIHRQIVSDVGQQFPLDDYQEEMQHAIVVFIKLISLYKNNKEDENITAISYVPREFDKDFLQDRKIMSYLYMNFFRPAGRDLIFVEQIVPYIQKLVENHSGSH